MTLSLEGYLVVGSIDNFPQHQFQKVIQNTSKISDAK